MAKGFLSGLAMGLVVVAGVGVVASQLAPQGSPAAGTPRNGSGKVALPDAPVVAAEGAAAPAAVAPTALATAPATPGAEPVTPAAATDGAKEQIAVVPDAAAKAGAAPVEAAPTTAEPTAVATASAPIPDATAMATAPMADAVASKEPAAPAPALEPMAPAVMADGAALLVVVPKPGGAPPADAAPALVLVALAQPPATDIGAALTVSAAPAEIPAPAAGRDQPAAAGKPPGMRLPRTDTLAGARAPDALTIPVVGTEPAPAPLVAPVGMLGPRVKAETLAEIGQAGAASVEPGTDPLPLADATPAPLAKAPGPVILAEAGTGTADSLVQPGGIDTAQPAEKPKLLELVKPGMPGSATAPKVGFGATVPGVRLLQPDGAPVVPIAAEPDAAAEAMPAVRRNAAACANPDGKPVFSVILIDDGGVDPAKLTGLGFPVTVALDPTAAGVAAAEAAYREAGLEVLILASTLPEGATATDLEVTFQSYFNSLPGAVAVLDLPLAGVQVNRVMAQQMVAILGDGGFGLVTLDRGLDPAAQVATRERLAQARIFRELDGAGENVATIRRYLDRAAFRAAQEGSVVVLGHAQDATLQALVEWAAEGRAGNMALCPITGVMAAG